MSKLVRHPLPLTLALVLALAACSTTPDEAPVADFPCDPDNGGITLPDGLCAAVFADDLGIVRHIAVAGNGDVYVARRPIRRRDDAGEIVQDNPGGVAALRDTDGDGRADVVESVNDVPGTGVAVHDGHLYYSSTTEVLRLPLDGSLVPEAEPELIVGGFPSQGQHASKPITFDADGNLYVTVGAPSNACQEAMRTPGSPGMDPCPQLEVGGGIWRFNATLPGQTQAEGIRYATGIRNAVALDWNPRDDALYVVQHGRDSLDELFPELFTAEQRAEIPAEELFRVGEGDDFGWPYCYYDPFLDRRVLAPEYGGDGEEVGRCADTAPTLVAYPAHWAPNDMLFYQGERLTARYDGGLLIAFHGSWNRQGFQQQGYRVVFQPFADGMPAGEWETFADGFAGVDEIRTPGNAEHRPMGLAQGPDGSLYITDSRQGRIWRVRAEQ
jgi:glucose/arabinose dehydrogenase